MPNRTSRTTIPLAKITDFKEAILFRVASGQLRITPLSIELQPAGRIAAVVGGESACRVVVRVPVGRERGIPGVGVASVVVDEEDRYVVAEVDGVEAACGIVGVGAVGAVAHGLE